MPNRRLVVNADDLGLADSVNRGIAETIEMGIVTSTSLIVNLPACDDAIRRLRYLRALGRHISVGLHFNVVIGSPLTQCPSLTDPATGEFLPFTSLLWRAVARKIDLEQVRLELLAQLQRADALLAKVNMRVTHIDSHRHAHCLPGVFELVLSVAKDKGISHVRHPYESRPMRRRTRAVVASKLLRAIQYRDRPLDDVSFAGVGAIASPTFHRDITEVVADLPAGTTELMVHPGYDSAELAAIDGYRDAREREVHALISPRLREKIQELGVELTHFGAVDGRPGSATALPA